MWIHLVDPATNATVAQIDVVPLTGLLRGYPGVQQIQHPVTQWHQGEWVAGTYNLALPATLCARHLQARNGHVGAAKGLRPISRPRGPIVLGGDYNQVGDNSKTPCLHRQGFLL